MTFNFNRYEREWVELTIAQYSTHCTISIIPAKKRCSVCPKLWPKKFTCGNRIILLQWDEIQCRLSAGRRHSARMFERKE